MVQARHRIWAWGLIISGVAAGLLIGGLAHAADPPTVTFTATGLVPVACGSRPSVESVEVAEGTPVMIANRTGVSARVVEAGQTLLTVADGEEGALTLTAGHHEVVLVPQCILVTSAVALVVTVTAESGPPTTAEPSPSASPSTTPPPALGSPVPSGSGKGLAAAGPGDPAPPKGVSGGAPATTDLAVSAASASAPARSASESRPPAPGPSGVVQGAEAIPWSKPEDPKGVRLLAVIAAICVLGVTAAIIRSIVRLDA